MSSKGSQLETAASGGGERRRAGRNAVRLQFRAGGLRLDADIRVSAGGLLAIGGLVSTILLSTAVLVGVATSTNARNRRR